VVATRELQFREASAVRIILSASATPALAAQIFGKFCDIQPATSAGGVQPLAWKCLGQLRELGRAIPIEIAVTGMMASLTGTFDADTFRALVEIFGRINANNAGELRSALSEPLRQSLRRYLKDGISKVLSDNLFDDSTRSSIQMGIFSRPG